MPWFARFGLASLLAAGSLQVTSPVCAGERMQLGAPDIVPASGGIGREFRGSVGDRVFFGEGSAELGSRARVAIEAQAQWLRRKGALTVTVEGHADDAGTGEDNMQLSRDRANAVRNRLLELGVGPERIQVVAFGRERTVADCVNSSCAAQNRRAVTVVLPGVPAPAAPADALRKAETVGGPLRPSARRMF